MWCTKHGRRIDVWYDCRGCLRESDIWARANGYLQCVSPHIEREGTDNGLWVTAHEERWGCIGEALEKAEVVEAERKRDLEKATYYARKIRRIVGPPPKPLVRIIEMKLESPQ